MNLAQATRPNHAFIIYFHCIISFSLKMTAFSQECPMFFSQGNKKTGGKKCRAFLGLKKAFGFAAPPVHIHECTHSKHAYVELWLH